MKLSLPYYRGAAPDKVGHQMKAHILFVCNWGNVAEQETWIATHSPQGPNLFCRSRSKDKCFLQLPAGMRIGKGGKLNAYGIVSWKGQTHIDKIPISSLFCLNCNSVGLKCLSVVYLLFVIKEVKLKNTNNLMGCTGAGLRMFRSAFLPYVSKICLSLGKSL